MQPYQQPAPFLIPAALIKPLITHIRNPHSSLKSCRPRLVAPIAFAKECRLTRYLACSVECPSFVQSTDKETTLVCTCHMRGLSVSDSPCQSRFPLYEPSLASSQSLIHQIHQAPGFYVIRLTCSTSCTYMSYMRVRNKIDGRSKTLNVI